MHNTDDVVIFSEHISYLWVFRLLREHLIFRNFEKLLSALKQSSADKKKTTLEFVLEVVYGLVKKKRKT